LCFSWYIFQLNLWELVIKGSCFKWSIILCRPESWSNMKDESSLHLSSTIVPSLGELLPFVHFDAFSIGPSFSRHAEHAYLSPGGTLFGFYIWSLPLFTASGFMSLMPHIDFLLLVLWLKADFSAVSDWRLLRPFMMAALMHASFIRTGSFFLDAFLLVHSVSGTSVSVLLAEAFTIYIV